MSANPFGAEAISWETQTRDTSLEKRKRRLIEHAAPLMGADDAQRLTTMLRPGAAPTLAGLAARGSIDERRRAPSARGRSEKVSFTPAAAPSSVVLRTFDDYGSDFGWFAHCLACFHDRDLSDADIAQRFGLDADVDAVRRRLRCAHCGAPNALLYRYYRRGMHGPGEGAYRAP